MVILTKFILWQVDSSLKVASKGGLWILKQIICKTYLVFLEIFPLDFVLRFPSLGQNTRHLDGGHIVLSVQDEVNPI